VVGTSFAFFHPTLQASIGMTVPRGELAGAVSLNIVTFNVARTVGPALGGALVAVGGAFSAFVFNIFAGFVSVVLLLAWRPSAEAGPPPAGAGIVAAIGEGLRWVRDSPQLRAVILRIF